ncbi:hypothetical protein [Jidongwangia harbinensis]|uniref:hypothetical protein n=1 Tax=Jidongwangia harbinensis TaxID=2878561 RepID=UPI001CDA41E9|nr:hypothetical protein [Jidongwangia harbinensis]MCA2211377.1 hypothetical protein [Jidongwangia harbinensis]
MTDHVAWVSLVAAALLFLLGMADTALSWHTTQTAKKAVANAAAIAKENNKSSTTLEQQSAIDYKGSWEALASLATALKDLDRSSRLFVLSLAFLAVAAVAAGTGDIATAVSSA